MSYRMVRSKARQRYGRFRSYHDSLCLTRRFRRMFPYGRRA